MCIFAVVFNDCLVFNTENLNNLKLNSLFNFTSICQVIGLWRPSLKWLILCWVGLYILSQRKKLAH